MSNSLKNCCKPFQNNLFVLFLSWFFFSTNITVTDIIRTQLQHLFNCATRLYECARNADDFATNLESK